jgi:hypothetical protein
MYILIETKLWHKISGYRGLTLWPFIFVDDKTNKGLIEHEKVHIDQQQRGWLIGFYVKYLYYNIKYGYWDNPYEVEARKLSGHS